MMRLGCGEREVTPISWLIYLKNLGGRMTSAATGRASRGRPMSLFRCGLVGALLCLGLPLLMTETAHAQAVSPIPCSGGTPANPTVVKQQGINYPTQEGLRKGEAQPDLVVSGYCVVQASGQPNDDYYFGKVNVIDKGTLVFKEGKSSELPK